MKFNPRSLRVWASFVIAGVNLILGWLASTMLRWRRHGRIRVALYGHHFNGNLRALYDYSGWRAKGLEMRFIYLDHRQFRKYRNLWPGMMSALRLDHMTWVAGADVIVADRSLGLLGILTRLRRGMHKVQTWHSVDFKGQPTEFFRSFRDFSLVLAPSEAFREVWWAGGAGVPRDRILVTGMARTDPLLRPHSSRQDLVRRLDLDPGATAYVLIAPTWKQDDEGRSIIPFGLSEDQFFSSLNGWAGERSVQVIFRAHLNTTALEGDQVAEVCGRPLTYVVFRSMDDYPLTEDLLVVSDVLVTDWSSIATDYLVLDRPVVYLDIPVPFRHGWGVLDDRDRPGPVVASLAELLAILDTTLDNPSAAMEKFQHERLRVKKKAFDDTLDGKSAERCLDALLSVLDRT